MMTTMKARPQTLAQKLGAAEAELATATTEATAARAIYSAARAAGDLDGMALAKTRAESAADLVTDASARVAAANDAIRLKNVAGERDAYLAKAEAVARELAAACVIVAESRAALAKAIATFSVKIQDGRHARVRLRNQLVEMSRRYAGDDLAADLDARGNVNVGGVLRSPQYPADWQDQKFGALQNGAPIDALIDALADPMYERGARLGAHQGVVI